MPPRKPDEDQIQRALVGWLDGWPDSRTPTTPALRPGVVCWHTPNGGQRSAAEGKLFKQMGVRAGIHDLLFLARFEGAPHGLLFGLELKDDDGRLSKAQLAMHPRLLAAGMYASAVVYTLDEAKAQLIAWRLTIY